MAEVESFQLDHTKVLAPYVRLIGSETGPKGDVITNFDVRFVQPNANAIGMAALHTIEHSMASLIRDRIDGMIDFSPFGCQTGFHMIMWGEHSSEEIAKVIKSSLEELASDEFGWDNVPGVAEKNAEITVITHFSVLKNGLRKFFLKEFLLTLTNVK